MKDKFTAYIGRRESGKTTRLYNIFVEEYKKHQRILVIDSATDHVSKSLIKRIAREYDHEFIFTDEETKIFDFASKKKNFLNQFVQDANKQVYLCDAGYFLELGYKYPPGNERERKRRLYKCFSMQVIMILLDNVDVILMDEIEMLPEFYLPLKLVFSKEKKLFLALHDEKGLFGVKDLFYLERM